MSAGYKDIINGCVNWERPAQERLYRLFSKDLFKVCKLYGSDTQDAEDMLHDAFMHIYKNIGSYNFTGSFEGWLHRVTVNCCLQALRKRKNFTQLAEIPVLDQEELDLETGISFAKVLEEINLLPTKAGLVLKLYALEGWSHSEIAEELEISVGTSKSQLNYARSVLKQKLIS
ncbi:sigma-70 family RNA polymerase sigma factor [Fluviicola sp.]|uniref:RNA polymerase sigma factor n=1 Tax=Fluviicola sp. TaxID=1917219 RepID=UPI002835F770|nr:sigma-70 family RNA polymerase sigma factor [Fluviicola sp.]MDR0801532.1 sigma-70 family RNA polymerase sigma factor [Fluviicola sp.]